MIGIGTLQEYDPESAALFSKIVERHALNIHCPWHKSAVLLQDSPAQVVGEKVRPFVNAYREAA